MKIKALIKKFGIMVGLVLVGYLLVLIAGFILVKYNITNTTGIVDSNTDEFQANEEIVHSDQATPTPLEILKRRVLLTADESSDEILKKKNLCRTKAISEYNPVNARMILQIAKKYDDTILAEKMILAVKLKHENNADFQKKYLACEQSYINEDYVHDRLLAEIGTATGTSIFAWQNNEEWQNLREALSKDKDSIKQASELAGIEPRILAAVTMVEQSRLYYTQRGLYKQFFAPLKILGNATKFSLGITGIKEKTAIQIENNLKEANSPFYLGTELEHILDMGSSSPEITRYARLTDEKDHYYSYLYGALYIRQLEKQWSSAGRDISDRPEIVSTLFNIGFDNSRPKEKPEVGGAEIDINDAKYSFGSLAYEFYYSGELDSVFGYGKK